jgi:hypothetical protein
MWEPWRYTRWKTDPQCPCLTGAEFKFPARHSATCQLWMFDAFGWFDYGDRYDVWRERNPRL